MGFLDYSGVTKATSYFKTKFAALVNGAVAIAQGGTGATTAANARVSLGTPASSSIATVESSTATVNHAKGSHFIVDGELRKATSAIASGEAITSSNSTTDTLQGQIDTLQDSVGKVEFMGISKYRIGFGAYQYLNLKLGENDGYTMFADGSGLHFIANNNPSVIMHTINWSS